MKIQSLGHVVLKVRDRAKAEAFYNGILGLPVATRSDALNMTFFTLGGTHHDFAIAEVGKDAPGTARELSASATSPSRSATTSRS